MEEALGIALGIGALIACGVSAYCWETRPRLRLLPVLYCACAGVVVALCIWDQNDLRTVMKAVSLFALGGLGLTFALWLQIRFGK
jgi:hypothetical protein